MRRTRHRRRHQLGRRGAAMAEAVIALPVFAIVLAGIVYFHTLLVAKQTVGQEARLDAWHSAVDGCANEPTSGNMIDGGPAPAQMQNVTNAVRTSAAVSSQSMFSSLNDIPMIGPLINSLVPGGVRADATAHVPQPKLLPFGHNDVTSRTFVPCNEKSTSPGKALRKAFTRLLPMPKL